MLFLSITYFDNDYQYSLFYKNFYPVAFMIFSFFLYISTYIKFFQ